MINTKKPLEEKIALFCNVRSDHVIEGRDVQSIYEVPLVMHEQNAGQLINDRLKINKIPKLNKLNNFIKNFKDPKFQVVIAITFIDFKCNIDNDDFITNIVL